MTVFAAKTELAKNTEVVLNEEVPSLQRQTDGAGAFDLHACIPEAVQITEHEPVAIPTGYAFEIPEGKLGLISIRSGHGCKKGVYIANAVPFIDSDYRGEVWIYLQARPGRGEYVISPLERFCQIAFVSVETQLMEVETLSQTKRGQKGFGSTGA